MREGGGKPIPRCALVEARGTSAAGGTHVVTMDGEVVMDSYEPGTWTARAISRVIRNAVDSTQQLPENHREYRKKPEKQFNKLYVNWPQK